MGALAIAASSGCTRPGPHEAPPDAAPSVPLSDAAHASIDGVRDYRGTLGASTAIAMHLVREGNSLGGSYVYTAIGRLIRLDGSADATGTIDLTETASGKVTGAFRLRPDGEDLAGAWTDPAGKKTFAVHLAPGAPFASAVPADDAGGAANASKRAEDCLRDAACSAARASTLFIAASDGNDPALDCFRFADGAGVPRNLRRARACLEHRAKEMACGGSSMSLETAVLASQRIDGIGGPRDGTGARALVDGCFDDAAREALLEHAAKKDHDPQTPPVDFCKDIGGTTITMDECGARDRENAETARALQTKALFESLDAQGKELFVASDTAYSDYVTAMGSFAYEVYIEGTIRGAMSLAAEASLTAARMRDLEAFPRFVAKDLPANEVASAYAASKAALAGVATTTPAEKGALEKTQQTWVAYRDADVAFYAHVFGPKQGEERVRAVRSVSLELRRAKECAPPSAGGAPAP
jgi:hypothetical protein